MREEAYSILGKPIPRVDGIIKAKGEAMYTTDLSPSGMLYGKILRSPYPHAKILSIDTSKAGRLKGVKAVITGRDIPKVKYGLLMLMVPETADRYLLAQDKVNFIGDEVAAVAAISEDIAEEALSLIEVEYEELPAVFSIAEATKPDAPLIHEGILENIHAKILVNFGDVEKGFQDSDYVREDRFVTQIVQHCALEPHVSLADFDSSGKMTLWTSTQAPFVIKHHLSLVLGMPERDIRVIKPYVGGAFGGKTDLSPLDLCCALLSKKSGRPVKICNTREEEFGASARRHPMEIEFKIGVKRDGTIMSRKAKIMIDGGAYNSVGPAAVFLVTTFSTIAYREPNIKLEASRVYTNKPPCGAMRGFTSPQAFLAYELQLDRVAEELGMDPIDLRIRNGTRAGDITVNGLKMKSGSLQECLETVAEHSEWKTKYKKLPPLRGIGVGASGFISGDQYTMFGATTASSTVFIKADTDGTVTIISGASDIGQGSDTVLCQIAAEELGIRVEDVRIIPPDTQLTPLDHMTAGARVTFMAGNAMKRAAFDLKQKLLKAVAERLEANIEDLEAREQRIYVKGSPEKGVSFMEAVAICQTAHNGMSILGEGAYNPPADVGPNVETGYGDYSPSYKYTAVVAEVEVDRETGRVKVIKFTFCDDCGRVINLLGMEGQSEGAIAMGIGYALLEEIVIEAGKVLNPCFLDYKIPTSMEIPAEMPSFLVESNDPYGPFGAKEGAEGTVGPIAPAILNAIYDATGIRFKEIPVTPEKILRAIKQKGGE